MYSAKQLSDAIRMKRKKLKEEGVENMVDTAALPQMNPQDVLDTKMKAQWEETMDLPEKSMAPEDPADADISGSSQDVEDLKKKMARVERILGSLKIG